MGRDGAEGHGGTGATHITGIAHRFTGIAVRHHVASSTDLAAGCIDDFRILVAARGRPKGTASAPAAGRPVAAATDRQGGKENNDNSEHQTFFHGISPSNGTSCGLRPQVLGDGCGTVVLYTMLEQKQTKGRLFFISTGIASLQSEKTLFFAQTIQLLVNNLTFSDGVNKRPLSLREVLLDTG